MAFHRGVKLRPKLEMELFSFVGSSQQSRPDFSGNWVLDGARSGPEPDIWPQRRPIHLVIRHNLEELTIDTGDGSLFGVRVPVVEDTAPLPISTIRSVRNSSGYISANAPGHYPREKSR